MKFCQLLLNVSSGILVDLKSLITSTENSVSSDIKILRGRPTYQFLFHIDHSLACFIFGVLRWDETLLIFSIYLFSVSGFLMSDSSCLMHYFSVFGYQMKHSFSCLIVWYVTAQCLDIRWNTPSRVWDILLLLFDTLLLVVWISDETLLHLFNILRLGVWISDETFLLVFDVLLLGVCYQMKHPCRLWYIVSILL